MQSVLNKKAIRVVIFLFHVAANSWGTSAVVAVTASGIIVGTDSKFSNRVGSYGPTGEHRKFAIIQHRIVIVDVGTARITSPRDGSELYEFFAWVNELKTHIPVNVTVDRFAQIVKAESAKKFSFVPEMMKRGEIKSEQPYEIYDNLVRYIIVGYDDGIPKLYVVEFDYDWNRTALVGPKLTPLDLSNATGDFHLHFFGQTEAMAEISNRDGYAYKQTMLQCQTAFGNLIFQTGAPLSLDETSGIVGALIKVEQNINPSSVGGTVRIAVVSLNGMAHEETYRPCTLPKAHSIQNKKSQ